VWVAAGGQREKGARKSGAAEVAACIARMGGAEIGGAIGRAARSTGTGGGCQRARGRRRRRLQSEAAQSALRRRALVLPISNMAEPSALSSTPSAERSWRTSFGRRPSSRSPSGDTYSIASAPFLRPLWLAAVERAGAIGVRAL
jgi:hypothetical protein